MKNRKIFHLRFLRQSCPFIIYLFIYPFIILGISASYCCSYSDFKNQIEISDTDVNTLSRHNFLQLYTLNLTCLNSVIKALRLLTVRFISASAGKFIKTKTNDDFWSTIC